MSPLVLFLFLFASAQASLYETPALQLESPPELAQVRRHLETPGFINLRDIVQLVGLQIPGPPIHVTLAPETSELARRVPIWVAGFAEGETNTVVIFPARSPGYPDDTLEDVLRHEVAHILIWRATDGRPVPRWFHEGFAMTVERARRFQDQTQLFYELIRGPAIGPDELNRLFSGSQSEQTRGYALAGAIVTDLFKKFGPSVGRGILSRIARGESFDSAFKDVTGKSPASFDSEFWRAQRIWTAWVPVLTSSTVLWLAITLLALLAIYARHRRNRQIEERWAEEDGEDSIN